MDGYKPKFSGHETFPLRYGWLKKAFDAVSTADGGKPVFLTDDAIARFGVGKNMVASMRHWATAMGVVAEDGCSTTPLGELLFAAEGLDPYMENPATIWLAHWHLCGDSRNTTWFWAFSHYPEITFEREGLAKRIGRLASDLGWRRAAASTVKNDIACLVRSYASESPTGNPVHEDSLESPLAELGLVRADGEGSGFRFVRGRKPTLGAGVFLFALSKFWARSGGAQTLSFEALSHEPGSPGRVFLLDETELSDRLSSIEEDSGGAYRWSETAGLRQLIKVREPNDEMLFEFVRGDYRSEIWREAA